MLADPLACASGTVLGLLSVKMTAPKSVHLLVVRSDSRSVALMGIESALPSAVVSVVGSANCLDDW